MGLLATINLLSIQWRFLNVNQKTIELMKNNPKEISMLTELLIDTTNT